MWFRDISLCSLGVVEHTTCITTKQTEDELRCVCLNAGISVWQIRNRQKMFSYVSQSKRSSLFG